jgi:hypothetical protein
MEVRATKLFRDLKEGVIRKKGDTFSISNERYKELNSTKFGILVEKTKKK